MTTAGPIRPALRTDRARGERLVTLRASPNAVLATVALASLNLTTMLGSTAALAFLLSGLALVARQPSRVATEVVRYWPVHLLSAWCLLSMFWSNEPGNTLRLGIQLGLTLLIAVAMATRLSAATLVRAVFAAYAVAMVASLLLGQVREDGGGWIGIFGSKNEFAFAMSTAALVSLAILLDRRAGRLLRLLGAVGLGLGCVLLGLGQSAGAIVSTVLASVVGLVLVAQRGASPGGRLVASVLAVLATVAAGLVAWGYRTQIAAAFLDTTGKDVTLTGRTDLWAEALREIAAHPLVGQGYQAFWVHGNPAAEALWAKFGIASRMGFNFHNTWLSNAVEIGLLGIGLQLALFVATLVLVFRWAIAAQTAASLFFAMFALRQAAVSLVEVVAYFNFSLQTILMVAALVYGLRVRAEVAAAGSDSGARPPEGRMAAMPRGRAGRS